MKNPNIIKPTTTESVAKGIVMVPVVIVAFAAVVLALAWGIHFLIR